MSTVAETKEWAVWVPAVDGILPVAGGQYTKVRWDRLPRPVTKQEAVQEATRRMIVSGPLRGLAPVVRHVSEAAPTNRLN